MARIDNPNNAGTVHDPSPPATRYAPTISNALGTASSPRIATIRRVARRATAGSLATTSARTLPNPMSARTASIIPIPSSNARLPNSSTLSSCAATMNQAADTAAASTRPAPRRTAWLRIEPEVFDPEAFGVAALVGPDPVRSTGTLPSMVGQPATHDRSRPRIALFLPDLPVGGVERFVANLARGLLERGAAVDVVTGDASGPGWSMIPDGARIVDLHASRTLATLPRLARYLREERPDALISAKDHANLVALAAGALSRAACRSS